MRYLGIEGKYDFDEAASDITFTAFDKEAIKAEKDFGQKTVVISIDKKAINKEYLLPPINQN